MTDPRLPRGAFARLGLLALAGISASAAIARAINKPLLAALLCAPLFALPARAQTHHDSCATPPCTIIPGMAPVYLYKSAGASQFISAATLTSTTSLTVPSGTTIAQICVETAGVRYRDDGVAPTASVGIPVVATSSTPACFQYAGPLSAIQFIALSGSPTMNVSYYYAF
jgi:hypothetical protein